MKEPDGSLEMALPLNVKHIQSLNALLDTGTWGSSPRQAAVRLIDHAIIDLRNKGVLE